MTKRKTEHLLDEVRRMAERLSESDDGLSTDEVWNELRQSGIDPDEVKAGLHRVADLIAQRERLAGRAVQSPLKEAIDWTRPGGEMPHDRKAAGAFIERWLDGFRSSFVLPANIEIARAYRRSGDIDDSDQQELDRLEEKLKERVKKENGRKD